MSFSFIFKNGCWSFQREKDGARGHFSKEVSCFHKETAGAINDVLREFCLLEQALPRNIVPLLPNKAVAGIAFTVKSAPNVKITGEMTFRIKMPDDMHEDSFVVWDTSKDEKSTLWGGVMTATAVGKKGGYF